MSDLLSLPRIPLAVTPTPLSPAPRLSAAVGSEIWFKRDDLTGLGLGGNKVRGLEFLLADARQEGCDCLVTGAGPQSNWAMLAALAARRVGLDPYLVFYGNPTASAGNHRLADLAGARVSFTGDPDRTSVDPAIDATVDRLRAEGRRPYALPRGGATPLGAVGYVRASLELAEQLLEAQLNPAQLWLATGSCATQAGLVAGARWLGLPYQVTGVTVSRPQAECVLRVAELAAEAAKLIGAPECGAEDVTVIG
ncbi:MAG: pyridoxal-phosphate dependent enzyme, partial [Actinomycetota bacterium]|nr:pyridoxal-phosphate dependent enzyme [Actinomycetota bacterium]